MWYTIYCAFISEYSNTLNSTSQVSLKTKYEDKDVMAHVDELLQELSSLPDLGKLYEGTNGCHTRDSVACLTISA